MGLFEWLYWISKDDDITNMNGKTDSYQRISVLILYSIDKYSNRINFIFNGWLCHIFKDDTDNTESEYLQLSALFPGFDFILN